MSFSKNLKTGTADGPKFEDKPPWSMPTYINNDDVLCLPQTLLTFLDGVPRL